MFEIIFYKDKNEKQPVMEYIVGLQKTADSNKDSRIKLNKIFEYLDVLSNVGTRAGTPYVKHIEGDIWELRPLKDRIFFFGWNGKNFVLLHHFVKETQKTPPREIEKAKRRMKDFLEGENYEDDKS